MNWIEEHRQYINNGLDRFFRNRYHDEVTPSEKIFQDAMLYAVRPDNRTRIHGILSMVVYEEVLGLLAADSVVDILIGLELIHISASLHIEALFPQEQRKEDALSAKYGKEMTILVGDSIFNLGIECLTRSGKMNVIQEAIHAVGDSGVTRGYARDINTDHDAMVESEYIAILDDKCSRLIGSALVTGALVTGDIQQRFLDELKRFGTFLSRLYQIRMDIVEYDARQKSSDVLGPHRKGVVDFLGYDKADLLRANIEYELVKMTNNFQSPKFKDLVEFFARETL